MKILFASEIFPPDIGGPATYVASVAARLQQDGHQVAVVTYSDDQTTANDKNRPFKIYRIKRQQNLLIRYLKYFFKLLNLAKNFEIIYAQGPIPSGGPAFFVKLLIRKKLVIKVVGDFSWERSRNIYGSDLTIDEFQNQKFSAKVKILRWLQKTILNSADLVITPSLYLKKIVSGWGVPPEKIKVIYNAVDLLSSPLTKAQAKNEIKINNDLIISAGRLVPWKGFDFLIKIFPKILAINPNFHLLIIGPGPDKEKLNNLIEENNLTKEITLIGQIPHFQLAVYFRAADFFILNTSYEGLSHLLVEALMMGLPIISTKVGGNPEVIEDGVNGLLVEYNNEEKILAAIKKIYLDGNYKNNLIANSKLALKKFQFEEMYKQTINIL